MRNSVNVTKQELRDAAIAAKTTKQELRDAAMTAKM